MSTITYKSDIISIAGSDGEYMTSAMVSNTGLAYDVREWAWNGKTVTRSLVVTHVASGRAIPHGTFSTPEQCCQFIEYLNAPIHGVSVDWHKPMEEIQTQLLAHMNKYQLGDWLGITATEVREMSKQEVPA